MRNKQLIVFTGAALLVAGAIATAGLPKLPKLPGTSKETAAPAGGTGSQVSQEGLVQRYVQASTSFSTALRELALAYGLKDHAAKLDAEIAALQSGAVNDKDSLKKNSAVSSEAQAAVKERMDQGEKLTDEGKKHYNAAWQPYIEGYRISRTLPGEAQNFKNSAQTQIDSASMLEKAKVVSKLSAGMYLAGEAPGFLGRVSSGFAQLVSYAQKNDIAVPKDATSLL